MEAVVENESLRCLPPAGEPDGERRRPGRIDQRPAHDTAEPLQPSPGLGRRIEAAIAALDPGERGALRYVVSGSGAYIDELRALADRLGIADSVAFRDIAFFEPSTVALHGVRHAGFSGGGSALVLGAGTGGYSAAFRA